MAKYDLCTLTDEINFLVNLYIKIISKRMIDSSEINKLFALSVKNHPIANYLIGLCYLSSIINLPNYKLSRLYLARTKKNASRPLLVAVSRMLKKIAAIEKAQTRAMKRNDSDC